MKEYNENFNLDSNDYDSSFDINSKAAPDDIDPEKLKLTSDDADLGIFEEGDGKPSIKVRKPTDEVYVRIHPKFLKIVAVLKHPKTRESYLLEKPIYQRLDDELKKPHGIYFGVTQDKEYFLWVFSLRNPEYSTSVKLAAEAGMKSWVRIFQSDYRVHYKFAKAMTREPEWPSDMSEDEILASAYRNRIIKSFDHPLILRIQGIE